MKYAKGWLLVAFLAAAAFGQSELDVAERIRLRELLRVSATTEFSQQTRAPLPSRSPYKVFLGFGLDFETHNNFVRWIEEWNQKQGTRYAKLIVTEAIQQAQIVLARFPGDETILDVTSYMPKPEGSVYDKTNTQREYYTAVFSYILLPLKTEPLHLQAIWRHQLQAKRKAKDAPLTEKGTYAGWHLRNALFNLLKHNKPRR